MEGICNISNTTINISSKSRRSTLDYRNKMYHCIARRHPHFCPRMSSTKLSKSYIYIYICDYNYFSMSSSCHTQNCSIWMRNISRCPSPEMQMTQWKPYMSHQPSTQTCEVVLWLSQTCISCLCIIYLRQIEFRFLKIRFGILLMISW